MAASSEMPRFLSGTRRSLEHPLHEHPLTLREITKDWSFVANLCNKLYRRGRGVECLLCKQEFHGPMYCCEDCDFILHEACAQIELPPMIEGHPSHCPDHPLNLMCGERTYTYCCSDCGFNLGALTAIATCLAPQDVEEDTIWHFGHEEHPLSSFHVESVLEVQCGSCRKQIFAGQVYGCRSCLFLLHEPCARLTIEIQHPLHLQHPITFHAAPPHGKLECRVCGVPVNSGPAYCCECGECRFNLHVGCTAQTMDAQNGRKNDMEEEEDSSSASKHHLHDHPLTLLHVGKLVQPYIHCKVCTRQISGAGAFACRDCRFFLHKSCVDKLPEEILHPLHPQHPRLVLRSKDSFDCNSCLDYGFHIAFSCEDCEFNLHPTCAFQTLSAIEDGAAACISHIVHDHPLMLGFKDSNRHFCAACSQFIHGASYSCTTCNYFLIHRSCAELPLKLEHPFHSQHPLVLSKAPASCFFCFVCHQNYDGLAFYCVECEFYMDVGCASLSPTIKHARHEHPLAYCERNTTKQLQCSCCGKRCKYYFYCCMRCNFSLHRDCLHLPHTAHHKSHWHPLELCDKFVQGNPDDQYCDYCETVRDPDHGVYRCEECNFSAHIECIIYGDKEEAEGLKTWGSDADNQLNIQIASRKAKIEITRRDLEAMVANLGIVMDVLAETERESKP